MPSRQPRVDFQKCIEAYSTLSANLLTELDDLNLLRELVRQAEVAAEMRHSVQTRRPAGANRRAYSSFLPMAPGAPNKAPHSQPSRRYP
jgi:hypothetical protein